MKPITDLTIIAWLIVGGLHVAVMIHAVMVADRDPYARAAWLLLLLTLPLVGLALYLLFGETWITERERRRWNCLSAELSAFAPHPTGGPHTACFAQNSFRSFEGAAGWKTTEGNTAHLLTDSNASIDRLVADIEAAERFIHLSFYIWLDDRNGTKVVEAVCRAASRGVQCRIAADALGSRAFIRSRHWDQMKDAGAQLCRLLSAPIGLGLLAGRRTDLRNHRKIAVIDGKIAYCGSQNCADPDFLVKAAYAPWVDCMLRLEGPVARQTDLIFAQVWARETGEDMGAHFATDRALSDRNGFRAIAAGTGPLSPHGTMSDLFVSAISAAAATLTITTPYFAPDPGLAAAIVAAARRGVHVHIVFPHRNDSRIVGAISRAYYPNLASAGVSIFEFQGGLLHAKTLLADDRLVLIGSSNMDRRSLDLNYENNVLLDCREIAQQVRKRQEQWLNDCKAIPQTDACNRPLARRFADNLLTMIAPVF